MKKFQLQPSPTWERCDHASRAGERGCATTWNSTGNFCRAIIVYLLIKSKTYMEYRRGQYR